MLLNYKTYIIFTVFALFSLPIYSQNLVYNGSFEIRQTVSHCFTFESYDCPCKSGSGFDGCHNQLKIAKGWHDPEGTRNYEFSSSDFYHSCGNDSNNLPFWWTNNGYITSDVGVPKNNWLIGYQYARTGEGYAGSGYPGINYWESESGEYIQSKLLSHLDSNKTYKISFHTVRGNHGSQAIETLGAYLSNNEIDYNSLIYNLSAGSLNAQLVNSDGYTIDTLNWTKIEGEFVAKGDEQYITIGNMDLVNYNPIFVDSSATFFWFATYAFDDIAVYEIDAPYRVSNAGNDTSICFGDSVILGKTNVPDQYKSEYFYEWFIAGDEKNIISHLENPTFVPTTNTTYVLKLTDFKYDKTYDTISVEVLNCSAVPEVLVYPNPANNWVKFEINDIMPTNTKIQIYDISGSLVQEQQYTPTNDQRELEMQLNNLAQGIYGFTVLFDDKRVSGGKLIVIQ